MLVGSSSGGPDSLRAIFQSYCKELDGANEKRDRLSKASRDITSLSKKLIFSLHRLPADATTAAPTPSAPPAAPSAGLQRAALDLGAITEQIATRIGPELGPHDALRFARTFSPGLQEYVEAALFLHFLTRGALLPRAALERELGLACAAAGVAAVPLSAGDYVLGAADLGGELMRHAVAAAARGAVDDALRVRDFLVQFQPLLAAAPPPAHAASPRFRADLDQKARVLAQSIAKVERACFDLSVRRAEFPGAPLPALTRPAGPPDPASAAAAARAKRRRVA